MSNPLHAAYYPDRAVQLRCEIVENVRLAKETYRVRVLAPQIARRILPGQFVMLRLPDVNDPLIGRPLALYDTTLSAAGDPEGIDLVYLVKGKLTSQLGQQKSGQRLEVWGPLGNGFCIGSKFRVPSSKPPAPDLEHETGNLKRPPKPPPIPTEHLIMVAGGIGYTPFLALAQEALGRKKYGDPPREPPRALRVTFCYGARSADYLAGVEDFERLAIDIRLATDDGSRGHRGFVTDLLKQVLTEHHGRPRVVCCGPEAMMAAAASICRSADVPCQVSLETPMACGIGICFTCVAKVRQQGGGWDYKRTCVEGPVFEAEMIEW